MSYEGDINSPAGSERSKKESERGPAREATYHAREVCGLPALVFSKALCVPSRS